MKGTEDATTDRSGPVPVVAISARFVVGVALIGVAMVNIANGLAVAFRPWEDSDRVGVETAEWLLLVSENNPSTWLASILLALGAGLSLMVARVGPRSERIGWYGVAGFSLCSPWTRRPASTNVWAFSSDRTAAVVSPTPGSYPVRPSWRW